MRIELILIAAILYTPPDGMPCDAAARLWQAWPDDRNNLQAISQGGIAAARSLPATSCVGYNPAGLVDRRNGWDPHSLKAAPATPPAASQVPGSVQRSIYPSAKQLLSPSFNNPRASPSVPPPDRSQYVVYIDVLFSKPKQQTMADTQIDCPSCGSPMTSGCATIHGTFWGFLFFGMSWQHLWFANEQGETRIMKSNNAPAERCSTCGTIVIRDDDWLIENADAADQKGDTERALALYRVAAKAGIDREHAQQRIRLLESKVKTPR